MNFPCVHSSAQPDCPGCWEGRAIRAERHLDELIRLTQSLTDSCFNSVRLLRDIGNEGLRQGGEQYPNAECAYDQANWLQNKAAKIIAWLNKQFGGNLPGMLKSPEEK